MLFNGSLTTECPIRQKIRDFYRIDENQVINHILPLAEVGVSARSRAWERARQMVVNIRNDQEGQGGIDALLNEFSLSSEEGVVLMCLAEALLRVPDAETQDSLIRDKLANGDWSSHLGNSDSLFVNASSWGLLVTGKMVSYSDRNKEDQFGVLKRTIGRLGEPVIRKSVNFAMKIMGKQFVMGRTIDEAIERAVEKEQKGYAYSYDMLGEGARTMKDADRYFESYMMAIDAIGEAAKGRGPIKSPGISVKLSAIHPRYEFTHKERVMNELVPKLKKLAMAAKSYDIGFTVDAEEADRLDISLDVIEVVFSDEALGDWNGFGLAVQAYQKRAIFVIEWLRQLTERVGRKLMVRLVKGAYWDTEVKTTQQDGLEHFPVFTRKAATDVCYKACAIKLMEYRDTIYPQFATHNAYTAATVLEMAEGDTEGFEFQRLHGMGESLFDQIVTQDKVQCRVYAPVGQHEDLLAYLVRRLLENGANSSFVNAIVDESKPVESLLPDPVEKIQRLKIKENPQIDLPKALYGEERDNSSGVDLTDINHLTPMKQNLDKWFAANKLSLDEVPEGSQAVTNPANLGEIIGHIRHQDPAEMKQLVENAEAAFSSWSKTPVQERADVLRRTADILERHRDELIALCIKEAGKVAQDGVDEVREAVDFCRYYAARAEALAEDDRFEARGVILCISPWNFPLAIFLGQVAAAVVTGNTVIAKPAEQTSLIAIRTIELMQTVGLPEHVVQPVIARGSKVGQVIVPDERIKAVMFTGSTETGTRISQTLAERGGDQVPLIAETGGQNCMIVDSTALPEQVVDDVISSGFQSAGQRCSALRVLFVQQEIADKVITMLKGAMEELHVGNPEMLSTDVGPVIDQKALDALNEHVEYMKNRGSLIYQCEVHDNAENDHFFFAPRLYEIENLSVLKNEVFGPCVHVIRFDGTKLDNVINQVNSTGFGLTMGIHSRIQERADYLARASRAGNVYINRNMIGAVVGVQPFGGRGLSGTGPKAGGPGYLTRLVKEKASPENVQATNIKSDEVDFQVTREIQASVSQLMANARKEEKNWRNADLNDRISTVRQLIAKVATVESVNELADDLEQTLSDARAQLIRIEKRLSNPVELPGPTGESNKLYLEPRGCVVCYADKDTSFNFWAISIISALAAGNTVITVVSDLFHKEALAFREKFLATGAAEGVLQVAKLSHLQAILAHPYLSGAVVGSGCERKSFVNVQLAARKGAILPVISSEYYDTLINRLLTEKTVSIDTTASGGNTSLMTLTEDDE
ncbi:bifunctional proline dehydrogenase/L-glutamate gamma-semialdehyde dehydrogenase PutA [Aliikangiella coralliicola]|uniref:Bifunctional protein PutA n=1 Tax=Aliikangiella coralliicola TaxID=2592383 RepID=A0A545UDY3_9GAMM|nr:bifunctional proline dehydrogenase/L-glutamate gamma-semialdehyde dehydrogenase PutA [Aliikangiella coralliicola]TQV87685.1 bifunctional proline dehydrogenase/L-glutamate gamma-semialdehyde dehydrogenase PutA [Aliikangiella coralliicola]